MYNKIKFPTVKVNLAKDITGHVNYVPIYNYENFNLSSGDLI